MAKSITAELQLEAFQTIVQQSPVSTQIFDKSGTTIFVNNAWEYMWHVKPKDILYTYNILQDKQLVDQKIMPLIQEAFQGKKHNLPIIYYEPGKTIPNKSKIAYKWVGAIIYPLKNAKHEVTNVVLQHYDVTREYKAQQKLQESEVKFRTIFEANIIGMFIADLQGNFLEANNAFLSMIGYSKNDLKKGKIERDTLTPPEYDSLSEVTIESLLTAGKSKTYEKYYIRKDGRIIPVLLAVARIADTDTCVGFALDMTERKKAEEGNYRLASLVNSSDDAIISKTLDSIIMTWNPAAEKLFGYTAAEAIGQHIFLIIPEKLHSEETEIINKIKKGERIQHFQTMRRKKDGTLIPLSLTISPIFDKKGRIIGASKIARDITEQKRVEKEKSDFLSMASHELKTPLTSMKMFLELLERLVEPTDIEQAKYFVNRIHDQTNQLVELTNDLLDVSRVETGKLRLNIEEFPLDNLIHETIEAIATSTRTHKLIINNAVSLLIRADRYRIFQVLINLLTNAIKYSPPGKDIVINLEKNHHVAIVSVQDFGIGISKDHQEKIFERLYQVNEPREKTYPGLGLGLYISKEIVERHKGEIWVESVKGKGSTFAFSLPLVREEKLS